jgi:hypothetical protein
VQAATLDQPGSGGGDPDHRLLYEAYAQTVAFSHKQLRRPKDLHLNYSGTKPRPTLASYSGGVAIGGPIKGVGGSRLL